MKTRYDLECEVVFLPTEQGGRRSSVRSGYRGQLHYDGADWAVTHHYPDVDEVRPGDAVRVYLTCLSPQIHDGKLFPGKSISFREGTRTIAAGTVTTLLDLHTFAQRASVTEALESYDKSLGAAIKSISGTRDEGIYWRHLRKTADLRHRVNDDEEMPDLGAFIDDERTFLNEYGLTGSAMSAALTHLEEALSRCDGPT